VVGAPAAGAVTAFEAGARVEAGVVGLVAAGLAPEPAPDAAPDRAGDAPLRQEASPTTRIAAPSSPPITRT